jgi:exonuclease III
VHKKIISVIIRAEFVSDRMPHVIQRAQWCHNIVLNIHAPTEDRTVEVKHSFYKKLESVFDKFSKNHMKILLGDFNVKVSEKDICKPTTGN